MGSVLSLREFDALPDGFLDARADALETLLGGPALIHLPGRRPAPLFISVLLHGNETSGHEAVKTVLRRHAVRGLPRAVSLFVGNVSAARAGLRRLAGQPDFNRVWPGTETPDRPEALLMADVIARVGARRPFASVDIHNNTGINPHYSCIVDLDAASLRLAQLFSRIAVLFHRPLGVQARAARALCPAVTVECGKVGHAQGDAHAADFIDAALHLDHFPPSPPAPGEMDLLHTVAIVKVPAGASFSFDGAAADYRFRGDLDHFNFRELAAGTSFGHVRAGAPVLEIVAADSGARIEGLMAGTDGELRLGKPLFPSMLTIDEAAVRNDCLCYLMKRIKQ